MGIIATRRRRMTRNKNNRSPVIPMTQTEDREELKRALAALVPRMRRFAISLTGSVVDGDELVQAACERALSRLGQLRVEARLDSWLYQIMRMMWIDEHRSRAVRRSSPAWRCLPRSMTSPPSATPICARRGTPRSG